MEKHRFELRQVDAYNHGDGWIYNTIYLLASYEVRDGANEARAFKRELRKLGICFAPHATKLIRDDGFFEVLDAKTDEPLFVAVPA